MLVINGELIAVSKRVPGHVVGDGEHTIAELVDEVNRDPRRGIGHEKVLTRLSSTTRPRRLLAKKGYTPRHACLPRASASSSARPATCPPAAPRPT